MIMEMECEADKSHPASFAPGNPSEIKLQGTDLRSDDDKCALSTEPVNQESHVSDKSTEQRDGSGIGHTNGPDPSN